MRRDAHLNLDLNGVEEVILKHLARRRWGRVCKYATLSLAGFYGLLYPSILVSEKIGGLTISIFSLFLLVGGFICTIGSLFDRWIAEYTMLPALMTAVAVFGVAVLLAARAGVPEAIAYGLVILAFSFSLSARWRDVQTVVKINRLEHDADHEKERGTGGP